MSDANNSSFITQFGDELYSPSTKEMVKPSDVLAGKTVMIYFSAHWCPPCRRFTPMLISLYNKMKQDPAKANSFELVFVSLDRKESEYDDYVSNMPWKCAPFSGPQDGTRAQKIAMKYGASGIPHLVVVGNDGNVITSDGTGEVQMDPNGANFPWKPKGFSEVFPGKILTKTGLIDSSTLDRKHLMLYFSAHWCPPCRGFTPTLCEAYKKLKQSERGDEFELVFVSSDRDLGSFNEYYGEMPFCALPFEDRDAKQHLSKLFKIEGIPSLLILGPVPEGEGGGGGDRPLINDNLRGVIESGEFISEFPFHPKPYQNLSAGAADGFNEHRSLVVFCENEDDDEQREIVDAVKNLAEKMKDDSGVKFFYATRPGGLVTAVRKLLRVENRLDGAFMALLDIPDDGGFYVSPSSKMDVTEDTIKQFLAEPGERRQLTG